MLKQLTILIILYFNLIELLLTMVEARHNIHRRHFRRQIKENSINKQNNDLCTEPEDLVCFFNLS